jgi:hypothetical protein
MAFESEACRAEIEFIDRLVANDFRGLSAYELTQYLRGKIFVYVDFLLSQGMYTESECLEVNELLRATVRLIVAWLNKMPSIMQKCLVDLRREPELYLVDEDIALFQSGPELMALLGSMLCACHRGLRYYVFCDQNQQVS